jgi:OPA family glycerol-3-phosphate transporter-like MFS transporter
VTAIALETRNRLARWQAINLALLVTGYSGYYLCRSNLSVVMPLLIKDLGRHGMGADAARIALGSIASLGVLAYAIGKFPSGSLADLFGGRRNFLLGMSGSIVFTLLFAVSGSLPVFTLAWMGNRLVQSLGWAGAVKIASRWFSFRQYGTVMAVISLSYLFGDAAARQFLGVLIGRGVGWRGVFLCSGGVLLVLLLVCSLLRESPSQFGEPEPAERADNLFAKTPGTSAEPGLRQLLAPFFGSAIFWLACALSLGTTILRETFNLWTPTYFTQAAGMTPGEAAGTSALFFGNSLRMAQRPPGPRRPRGFTDGRPGTIHGSPAAAVFSVGAGIPYVARDPGGLGRLSHDRTLFFSRGRHRLGFRREAGERHRLGHYRRRWLPRRRTGR